MRVILDKAGRRLRGLALLFLGLLLGCRSVPPDSGLLRYSFNNTQMGTLFTITLYAADEAVADQAARAAFARILELDEILSDYRADSELNRLREVPPGQAVPVSQDLFRIIEDSQAIARDSGGAFDITAGPYVRLWRFSRKRHTLPSATELADARRAVGSALLKLDRAKRTVTLLTNQMQLDAGGIAKGYAADAALAVLGKRGIKRALVAASGDLAIGDAPPGKKGWRVEISGAGHEGTLVLANCGVSTSGSTEQFTEIDGVRYSHIINPATGLGLTNGLQVTVVAPRAGLSDPLATALCVLGPERGFALLKHSAETKALVCWDDHGRPREQRSRDFPQFHPK